MFDGVTISAPIDYVPATVTYSAQQSTPSSTANVSASLVTGLRGIGSNFAEFENKRANAGANFIHFNLDADYTQILPYDIQANARISWQAADQALVSSEQFAAGGLTSVRGYLQSEAVGDDGAFGSIELKPVFRAAVDAAHR